MKVVIAIYINIIMQKSVKFFDSQFKLEKNSLRNRYSKGVFLHSLVIWSPCADRFFINRKNAIALRINRDLGLIIF